MKRRVWRGRTILLVVAALALGGSGAFAADPGPVSIEQEVVADFDALAKHLESLPESVLGKDHRASLVQKVKDAQTAYAREDVCSSASILDAYLKQTATLRQDRLRTAVAEDLYNRGRSLRADVVRGQVAPSPCADPGFGRKPEMRIVASDNRRFQAQVTFGAPRLWTVEAGDETWTQIALPGLDSPIGPPGLPGVPSWQGLIALPRGARTVLVSPREPAIREEVRLNLHPFQEQPVDQAKGADPEIFKDPPFVKDEKAYATDALAPLSPCAVRPLGQYRDLEIAQVQCTAGQYNPVTDVLRLFDSVEFDVRFEGGEGTFVTSQTLSPFEPASQGAIQSVLNSAVVSQYVTAVKTADLQCTGEELLVLTHPDFRADSDRLAQWKRDKGISTTVIEVGPGTSYPSAFSIDTLIESRYRLCVVRPSYVLIMGDSEFVPPARRTYPTKEDSSTGSDLGYAVYQQFPIDQFLPDFGVGRMPVNSAAEAQRVVDKVINYESKPPYIDRFSGGPFYTTATVASFFQCCRTDFMNVSVKGRDMRSFVETSETVRNQLLASGYGVERIYNTHVGYADGVVFDPTPQRFWDGDLLPVDLRKGSGFPWDGGTDEIVDAFNAGRFNILHRDHGAPWGWADPQFTTNDLWRLNNGALLPVVYSVNCKSGYFDSETDGQGNNESFMEQLLTLPGGGMVGGLGDVRNSPSWENSALTRGFYDATWPNLAPEFGDGTVHRRLGDILNHGKFYLLSQVGVAQPAGDVSWNDVVQELILWHVFGDPTLEMWTSNPWRFSLPSWAEVQLQEDGLVVSYDLEGAEITALQTLADGSVRPVGRAVVTRGVAKLPFFVRPDPKLPIQLSASKENAVSVALAPR
jgi:hypothetical protein